VAAGRVARENLNLAEYAAMFFERAGGTLANLRSASFSNSRPYVLSASEYSPSAVSAPVSRFLLGRRSASCGDADSDARNSSRVLSRLIRNSCSVSGVGALKASGRNGPNLGSSLNRKPSRRAYYRGFM
jgi:hypothetical protein